MPFKSTQFTRTGTLTCNAAIAEVFPLLCPKKEEDWIPGWECETIWSHSGYNEPGAIFRTTKPYGTELYWTTLQYDINHKLVEFLIIAPHLYMFRFKIELDVNQDGVITITFTQTFTSVSEEGNTYLQRYEHEDFQGRLKALSGYMHQYLEEQRRG
jgi:hypothetical protein